MQTTTTTVSGWKASHFFLLVISLVLIPSVLTSCSIGESTDIPPTPVPTAALASPTPPPLPDGATTGARIRARGHLLVGVRYDLQPFGYVTADGEVAGLGVDMGRELARRWLGDAGAVQFRQVRSDSAVEHLQAGNVDIVITAFTHTQEWEAGADFSLPYFIEGHALLVRAPDAGAIGGLAALEGRPVGVVAWTDVADTLRAAVPFTLTLQTYDRFDTAVDALGRGEIDAVAELRHRLFWGQQLLPETAIVGQYTAAPAALAFPQDDAFFADLVNLTFQEMVADGTYADLYARWIATELPPTVERWPGSEVPSLADAPLVASVPDTIAAIESRGRLVVALASDRFPFAYVDAEGVPAGYEVNLAQRMAGRWLGDVAAVEFVPVPVETGQEMLRNSQADLLVGALPHSRATELDVDFGLTTYVAGEGLLIWAGTPITDVISLHAQQVAVSEGSGSGEVLLAAAQSAGISVAILPQPTLENALALLEGGQVIAVAGDRADLMGPAYSTPGLGVLPLRLTQVPLALALPPGDSAFRDLVNLTLQAMKVDGEFDALYTAWFDDVPPPIEVWPGVPYRPLQLQVPVTP